jgi:hypothetical protein
LTTINKMDHLTIVGAVDSVASIIDVLAKSISNIQKLQDQYKSTDPNVLGLVSKLVALKNALIEIQKITDSDSIKLYHDLVINQDIVVRCCNILVKKVDAEASEFLKTGQLDKGGQIEVVLENVIDGLSDMIERQTTALNAILAAHNM